MLLLVSHDIRRKYKYAYKDTSFKGFEHRICAFCGRTISDMHFKEQGHCLILEGGKIFPDYLQFCGAGESLFLLSDQAVRLLEQSGISGISAKAEVQICDDQEKTLFNAPRYFSMEVCGCVEMDFDAMHLKKKNLCPECGQFTWNRQRVQPMILDRNSWDGSDICRVGSIPGYFACSKRFVDFVKKNGVTGFVFSEA